MVGMEGIFSTLGSVLKPILLPHLSSEEQAVRNTLAQLNKMINLGGNLKAKLEVPATEHCVRKIVWRRT